MFSTVNTSSAFRQIQQLDPIELSLDWLNILTPPLSSTNNSWTTLSAVIDQALSGSQQIEVDYDNKLELGERILLRRVEAIVSSFIVDGISRVGWDDNHLSQLARSSISNTITARNSTSEGWHWGDADWHSIYTSVLEGKARLKPNPTYRDRNNGQMYEMKVTVTGYGIMATSLTEYLSLGVLYLHAALVIVHVIWTLYRADDSTSWSTLTEMLVLSQSSPPPDRDELKNTCAGVSSSRTLRLRVRIREGETTPPGSECLRLLIDDSRGEKIKPLEKYGAVK